MTYNLTQPSADSLLRSQHLIDLIRHEIQDNNGKISFSRYMELALYAPGCGYYASGASQLGQSGDFVTAPLISPLFSHCLARQCGQVLSDDSSHSVILEFGAGNGIMAADILLYLERIGCLPENYLILEVSGTLKEHQYSTLKNKCPHLLPRIQWLTQLPEKAITGVILANEVIDAMPVTLFEFKGENAFEKVVTWKNDKFYFEFSPLFKPEISSLKDKYFTDTERYSSELNLYIEPWIKSLSTVLEKGLILLCDYGFPRHEYYHQDRSMGTLMCHYQHHAHPDPFFHPGLQDITAHVDFTAIAESAENNSLVVSGYTNQANFLMNCGITEIAEQSSPEDIQQQLVINNQLKKLLMPHEMGELFKVLSLTKHYTKDLIGFSHHNLLHKL